MDIKEVSAKSYNIRTPEENALMDATYSVNRQIVNNIATNTEFRVTPREGERATPILLCGPSGCGKTFSFRTIPQEELVIFDFDDKGNVSYDQEESNEIGSDNDYTKAKIIRCNLSLPSTTKNSKGLTVLSPSGYLKTYGLAKMVEFYYYQIKNMMPEKKYFVFDTLKTFMVDTENVILKDVGKKGVGNNTRQQYLDMAMQVQDFLRNFLSIGFVEDNFIFVMHSELTPTGEWKIPTNGRMIEKVVLPALFSHVVNSVHNDTTGYGFITRGVSPFKTYPFVPQNMPNDMFVLLQLIRGGRKNAEALKQKYLTA